MPDRVTSGHYTRHSTASSEAPAGFSIPPEVSYLSNAPNGLNSLSGRIFSVAGN